MKNKIKIFLLIATVLSLAFFFNDIKNALSRISNANIVDNGNISSNNENLSDNKKSTTENSEQKNPTAVKPENLKPSETVEPVDPKNVVITDKKLTATISISCKTILDNLDKVNKEKIDIVPKDGIIFQSAEVTFFEGESVFDVLKRTAKENKIHMEFEETPIYNSAYIEGIANIYEFDVGSLSGWIYKVNGIAPGFGCSLYQLKDNDVIEWVYTCDLGRDVDAYVEGVENS